MRAVRFHTPLALPLLLLAGCLGQPSTDAGDSGDSGSGDSGDSGGGDSGDSGGGDSGDSGGGDSGDSGGDSGSTLVRPDFTIELTRTGVIEGVIDPGEARVGSVNNYAYLMDLGTSDAERGKTFRYLTETYTSPDPVDYCVEGSVDEDGTCRGTEWHSGRVEVDKPTSSFCFDQVNGRIFFVKDQGTRVEVIDAAMEGDLPYTYNAAFQRIDLSSAVQSLGKFVGACDYLAPTDEVVLTSKDTAGATEFVVVGGTDEAGALVRSRDLGLNPRHLYALEDGTALVSDDTRSGSSLYRVDADSLTVTASWTFASPVEHFGLDRRTGVAWIAHGTGGAAWLDTEDASASEQALDIPGDVQWAFADTTHALGWFVTDDGGTWKAYLVQDGTVRDSYPFDAPVASVAEPGDMGDLVVYHSPGRDGGPYTVLGPKPDRTDGRPPVYIYLFTTIEEPSDTNLTLPCAGSTGFEKELDLVYANASRIASLGVPTVMAITDNFGEKVSLCAGQIPADGDRPSVDGVYAWLQDTAGFELGAMLHNRPCYHCSSSDGTPDADGYTSNPDWCASNDPNFIAPTSSAACFPDDPEYCALGDWDCYYTFLQPRLEFADQGIPGGASFVVGADRHGMWDHDWIRFYQEIERERWSTTGFDVTMFAATWAYNNISYDDPRGKNPTPWRPQDRATAWRPGDIDAWSRDSAYSSLLYLPGINSAMVKISEQQKSGLYMADFFDTNPATVYDYDDFEVSWQFLRQAVNYRREDGLNTWYFHIHDNGLVNLGDASNNDVSITDDEGNTYTPMMPLEDFVQRINERYVSTGEVEWMYPSDIKQRFVDW